MPLNRILLFLCLFFSTPSLLSASNNAFRHSAQPLSVHHYNDLETLLLSGQPVRALINYQFCECDDDTNPEDKSDSSEEQWEPHRFIASVDWRTFWLVPPDHTDPNTNCLITFKHNFMNVADLNYLFFDNDAKPHPSHEHAWVKLTVNYAVCSDTPEQLNFHMSKRIVAANNPQENGMLYPQKTYKSRVYGHCPLSAIRFYRN